jgi:hypothetical protein
MGTAGEGWSGDRAWPKRAGGFRLYISLANWRVSDGAGRDVRGAGTGRDARGTGVGRGDRGTRKPGVERGGLELLVLAQEIHDQPEADDTGTQETD